MCRLYRTVSHLLPMQVVRQTQQVRKYESRYLKTQVEKYSAPPVFIKGLICLVCGVGTQFQVGEEGEGEFTGLELVKRQTFCIQIQWRNSMFLNSAFGLNTLLTTMSIFSLLPLTSRRHFKFADLNFSLLYSIRHTFLYMYMSFRFVKTIMSARERVNGYSDLYVHGICSHACKLTGNAVSE